ncbi:phosphocholine-specific phospholipase C [Paraburkholderia solisilvae]|uniref:phospholipase C n=1 Tax=Paraburkholderia solisilvae TaxID=624376 RepID=A0A6J5EX94_9BURK|nr:phospholipase C, phosphocholine-specific [Paraburkholderia solisilvae]CAB3769852.1 Non-hemolytic phospholipase C [Paraburkholderia solisilvae]
MTSNSRRDFLRAAAQAAGAATALGAVPVGIRNALAIPAHNASGTIADVEHIVVFMQENRSFDNYFGTLRGVRGFGDTRPIPLSTGKPVFYQPAPNADGYVLPFRPNLPNLGLQFVQDLDHSWIGTHAAWNNGRYDQWVPAKGATTMFYMTREDMPFHYNLADAFTICDAYHCSAMTPTDPNRYYMWTGWVGNDGNGGGPVIDNAEAGYSWGTFPEKLQAAGISWKVYQDVGNGLNAAGAWGWTDNPFIGNFGDTSLLYFKQYQNAQPGNPLYEAARTGTNVLQGGGYFDILRKDVQNNALPQVSYIVAPEAFSEHGNWPPNYGAWYVDQVLQALTSNPEVWSKTVLLITYDENDGLFDHMPPPYASSTPDTGRSTVSTANEFYAGAGDNQPGPYGLGPRVPMLVVSPWSKGGYVCSEVFDHTSVIRFIQTRFGRGNSLNEPNVTPWRRAVCGDLTSAFDFRNPNRHVPPLPATSFPADQNRHPDVVPAVPGAQSLPKQEPGVRPARALDYEFFVRGDVNGQGNAFHLHITNTGRLGATFLVYSGNAQDLPRSYTVEAGKDLADQLMLAAGGSYDFSVHGPNGFLRRFVGKVDASGRHQSGSVQIADGYDVANGNLQLRLKNESRDACTFHISSAYASSRIDGSLRVRGNDANTVMVDLRQSYGWYDLTITVDADSNAQWRIAGHVETGRDSMSDPALGS